MRPRGLRDPNPGCRRLTGENTSAPNFRGMSPSGSPGPARAPAGCETGVMTSPDSASRALFERAQAVTPGGVNSPVRAFRAVGGTPRFMIAGSGPLLYDADGTEYVDLVCSWGPMILGHAYPAVVQAVAYAAARGTSFGTPTVGEVELAEEIVARVP